MKVLILNGSPRVNGDTSFILNKVKQRFSKDTIFTELNAYKENIKPCIDCRYCCKNKGCSQKDRMDVVLNDDYDVLIIASPVYMSNLTPPLFSIITRLNFIWSNKYFLGITHEMKKKKGILILAGGGNGAPDIAIDLAKNAFKKLNADFSLDKNYIYSLKTDDIPVNEDKELDKQIDKVMEKILERD